MASTAHETALVGSFATPPVRKERWLSTYNVARVLMGLPFTLGGGFGLLASAGLVSAAAAPPGQPEGAVALMGALAHAGYMLPMIAITEFAVGILLLSNRYVSLALVLLAPVIVNIVAYHLFLAPATIAPAVVVLVLEVYLAWSKRASYRALLSAHA